MSEERGFEGLISWQKARVLNKEIYKVSQEPVFSKDFAFRDQIRRASISISSNIAEGYGRKTKKSSFIFSMLRKPLVTKLSHNCIWL